MVLPERMFDAFASAATARGSFGVGFRCFLPGASTTPPLRAFFVDTAFAVVLVAAVALVECGAYTNAQDRKGFTPLDRANKMRKREVAAYLGSLSQSK